MIRAFISFVNISATSTCFFFLSSHSTSTTFLLYFSVGKATIQKYTEEINRVWGSNTLSKMIKFVNKQKPKLWGQEKPSTFVSHMVVLTIIKDRGNIEYKKLVASVKLNYYLSDKSLRHNVQTVCRLLGQWGRSVIKLRNHRVWVSAASRVQVLKVINKKKSHAYL